MKLLILVRALVSPAMAVVFDTVAGELNAGVRGTVDQEQED